jgi:hypothetical protein
MISFSRAPVRVGDNRIKACAGQAIEKLYGSAGKTNVT